MSIMHTTKKPFSPTGGYYTKLAGVTFVDGFDKLIEDIQPGDDLSLVEEPDNPHDPNAISVSLPTGEHLGYIPRDIAEQAPDSLVNYSVYASRVYPGYPDLNAGMGVMIYHNDITEDELIESVKDLISAEDLSDFILLAYDAAGMPTERGAVHEISSRLRIRNCIRHLAKIGVDLDAVLFGDDLDKVLPAGMKVISEKNLTTLYADDFHMAFDSSDCITLTGYILINVASTIVGHQVCLGSLDDLES